VQNQLKVVLDAALAEARKTAAPGQMDVRTGNFSLYPRYGRDGKISGWQGSAELVLEGRDFAAHQFWPEPRARALVEADAQKPWPLTVSRPRPRTGAGFGFAGYTLREVSVNANDPPARARA
jgi:hypothetical protein